MDPIDLDVVALSPPPNTYPDYYPPTDTAPHSGTSHEQSRGPRTVASDSVPGAVTVAQAQVSEAAQASNARQTRENSMYFTVPCCIDIHFKTLQTRIQLLHQSVKSSKTSVHLKFK